jgi:hypothetical protein
MLCMRIKGLSVIWRICGALLLAGHLFGTAALAQAPANAGTIVVTDTGGRLRYRIGDSQPQLVSKGQSIPVGARLTSGPDSRVVLTFSDGQTVALGPMSRLLIREYRYLPNDPGNSRVLLNLTDGSVHIVMGAIGERDPSLVQIQVGTKTTGQAPRRAPGNDVGVIVLGIATLVQVTNGNVSLMVASSGESHPLAAGERALVQADGFVQMGGPRQMDELVGKTAAGKYMLQGMNTLQRVDLPRFARQTAVTLSTPPSDDILKEFAAPGEIAQPLTGTVPTAATGAGGGGLPCTASCN